MTQNNSNPFEVLEGRLILIESLLVDIKKSNAESSPQLQNQAEIGGIKIAQEVTGLARPSIYALVSQNKIPYMKKGKHLYFSRKELTDWIISGKKRSTKEIEAAADNLLSKKII